MLCRNDRQGDSTPIPARGVLMDPMLPGMEGAAWLAI